MAQFVVPAGDQATGSWSSTPLWSKIEEQVSSADGTTITSDDNTSPDDADFSTTDPTSPAAGDHILRALWNKDSASGHQINGVLELYQGDPAASGSLVATLTETDLSTTPTTSTYTLLSGEVSSISDYTDLFLRLSRQGDTGGNPQTRRSLVVDAIELEIPDAGAQNFNQTVSATATATPSISRKTAVTRSAVATASPTVLKKTTHTLAATASTSPSLDTGLSFSRALSATASATASLSLKFTFGQTLAATASATASLAARVTKRLLAATATATASLSRAITKTLSATASGVASLGTVYSGGVGGDAGDEVGAGDSSEKSISKASDLVSNYLCEKASDLVSNTKTTRFSE